VASARAIPSSRARLRSAADSVRVTRLVGHPISLPPFTHVSRAPFPPDGSCWRAMEPSSNPSLTRIFPRDRLWVHDHTRLWEHLEHRWRALWQYFWRFRKFWRYVDDAVDPSPMTGDPCCSSKCALPSTSLPHTSYQHRVTSSHGYFHE
jgi:hypothetical protein